MANRTRLPRTAIATGRPLGPKRRAGIVQHQPLSPGAPLRRASEGGLSGAVQNPRYRPGGDCDGAPEARTAQLRQRADAPG